MGGNKRLELARRRLATPSADAAAEARMVMDSCKVEADGAVKAAQRAVRDACVFRCRSRVESGERGAFLMAVEEAFGRPPNKELGDQLQLSYHNIAKKLKENTWDSRSSLLTAHRGGKRPKLGAAFCPERPGLAAHTLLR